MTELTFTIHGEPCAQGRGRAVVFGGERARVVDPKKSRSWKAYAVGVVLDQVGRDRDGAIFPKGTPVELGVRFIFKRPTGSPKTIRTERQVRPKKPDVDNLAKTVLDALTTAHLWEDDAQVVRLVAEKWQAELGEAPRIEVCVRVACATGNNEEAPTEAGRTLFTDGLNT